MGPYQWLTVVSFNAVELSLEPNVNPAAKTFQQAMFGQKIPLPSFEVADIDTEYKRLTGQGLEFLREPVQMSPVKIAEFSHSCGNWIQLYQPTSA